MNQSLVWPTRAGVLALALTISACGDDGGSLGPVEIDIDPADAASAMQAVVDQFVASNEALETVDAFTEEIFEALGVSSSVALAVEALPAAGTLYEQPEPDRRAGGEGGLPTGTDVSAGIPEGFRVTWVYDTLTADYREDPERTTPPNTARFILYTIDGNGEPVRPLEEIGYLDLIDTSDLPTVEVRVTSVIEDVTLVDVAVSGFYDPLEVLDIDFDGFISDGTEQLDVTLGLVLIATQATVDLSLDLGELTTNLTFIRRADDTGSVTVSFTDGTDTIEFRVNLRLELIDGESVDTITDGSGVWYNDRRVAVLTETLEDPTVTNGAGDPLTPGELQALRTLLNATGELFEAYDQILTLVLALVLLGLG